MGQLIKGLEDPLPRWLTHITEKWGLAQSALRVITLGPLHKLRGIPRASTQREPSRNCISFYDLAFDVIFYYFHILSFPQYSLGQPVTMVSLDIRERM